VADDCLLGEHDVRRMRGPCLQGFVAPVAVWRIGLRASRAQRTPWKLDGSSLPIEGASVAEPFPVSLALCSRSSVFDILNLAVREVKGFLR
jgi:hypothetical protein